MNLKQRQVQFPHISRFFSARNLFSGEKALLWTVLAMFLGINILNRNSAPWLSTHIRTILTTPKSSQAHVQLAMDFWDVKNFQSAERELLLANDLLRNEAKTKTSDRVLGATTSPLDLLTRWQEEPVQLKKSYVFWEKISREKRDYKDAYLLAGTYAYQLGLFNEARMYLSSYKNLGGTNVELEKLTKRLEETK